jgi:hypothetical protein
VEGLNDQLFQLTEGHLCAIAKIDVYEQLLAGGLLTGSCHGIRHTVKPNQRNRAWKTVNFPCIFTYVYFGSPAYGVVRGGWISWTIILAKHQCINGMLKIIMNIYRLSTV